MADAPPSGSRSRGSFFPAIVLPAVADLTGAILLLTLVPLGRCTGCAGLGAITWGEYLDTADPGEFRGVGTLNPHLTRQTVISKCTRCRQKGRLPLARVWLNPPFPDLYVDRDGDLVLLEEARVRRIAEARRSATSPAQ